MAAEGQGSPGRHGIDYSGRNGTAGGLLVEGANTRSAKQQQITLKADEIHIWTKLEDPTRGACATFTSKG